MKLNKLIVLILIFLLFSNSLAFASEKVHVVQAKETLYSIAKKYGIKAEELAKANKIKLSDPLKVGQKLTIPGHTGTTTKTTTSTKPPTSTSTPKADPIQIMIDGKRQSFAKEAIIKNGRVLVPMRGIFENLGLQVKWDSKNKSITAKSTDTTIFFNVGGVTATINGVSVKLDQRAEIIDGSTMVPIRFISESIGAHVSWESKKRIIYIRYRTLSNDEKIIRDFEKNNWILVEKWLLAGADPNLKSNNESLLEKTIKRNQLEMAKMLIRYSADVKGETASGMPYILLAVDYRNYDMVELLLKSGADPNQTFTYETYTRTPLDSAVQEIRELGSKPDIKLVQLLLEYGAKPTDQTKKWAEYYGNEEIIQLLEKASN